MACQEEHLSIRPWVVFSSSTLVSGGKEARGCLYGNTLGRALFPDLFADVGGRPNGARTVFLNPRAVDFYKEWDTIANDVVALLRTQVGRDPYDKGLSDLVGELSNA
jgi:hypothetical protein